MTNRRQQRLNDLLREELSEAMRDLRDPRLSGLTSITEVTVTPDLRSAKVYVSTLGTDEQRNAAVEGLEAAASRLRHELKARLRTMKYIPFMTFQRDDSIEEGSRLLNLMRESEDGGGDTEPGADAP